MAEQPIDLHLLFNEVDDGAVYPANEKWHGYLLDQYKLYVEMADRISSRRAAANSFFLTINTALLSFLEFLNLKGTQYLWLLAIAGISLSILWRTLIRSYRDLNSAKWAVIHQIEERLPIRPYFAEWVSIGEGRSKLYLPISHIEMVVPLIFAGLHAVVLLIALPSIFFH